VEVLFNKTKLRSGVPRPVVRGATNSIKDMSLDKAVAAEQHKVSLGTKRDPARQRSRR
jgi:hypothetical protein